MTNKKSYVISVAVIDIERKNKYFSPIRRHTLLEREGSVAVH